MSIVVSDTSPIRALVHLNLERLIADLFGEVWVPRKVAAELARATKKVRAIDATVLPGVRIGTVQDATRVADLMLRLDPGEAEAIALALEVHADFLLVDEAAARREAASIGLAHIGVLGILGRAKQAARIDAVGPLIDCLRSEIDFFVSESLRAKVMRAAGEVP